MGMNSLGIDPALHKQVRIKVATTGQTLKAVLEKLLRQWLKEAK